MAVPLHKLQQRVFKVFYRDHLNATSVASTSPQSMLSVNIAELAEQILQHPDSFIGIIDSNDTILQLYLDDDANRVMIELIHPDSSAGHGKLFGCQAALDKLHELPARFSTDWLLEASNE